ncbi:ribonuclease E inhibitor RraB [Rhodococcus sp. Z13]|uniref:Ribonuclease E inhibitor RraB n=1 Tax=Rhodococcus sacchari TaxID=2962047 RepID=A0ACD4DBQ8_9NOCA|nr:ribonuclease E inhibitor RraB [Rhodococcus sp. Z13]UYP17495.1 ribonuclease E inhibitor RraB [Rhodococcus sp. Z13]
MSTGKGLGARLRALFGRRSEPLDAARDDLVVVVSSFDDAEACSTALERGSGAEPRWDPEGETVLRHHLSLPAEGVDRAAELAAQDGYTVAVTDRLPEEVAAAAEGRAALTLQRVQVLDALHCAQEKSRMASLAQRLGGTALGWDALQPPQSAD